MSLELGCVPSSMLPHCFSTKGQYPRHCPFSSLRSVLRSALGRNRELDFQGLYGKRLSVCGLVTGFLFVFPGGFLVDFSALLLRTIL